MKCKHESYPVIFNYGFVESKSIGYNNDDGEKALFIDGGKIGGMVLCGNCGAIRMFMPDKETQVRPYGKYKK